MAKIGKRIKAVRESLSGKENVTVEEAVSLVKTSATAKFDETVEIAMNLGVDPRHADQMVRGLVTLPNGTGKSLRVAVFARGAKADEAKEAGADIVGAEDLMETIQGGTIEFDRCIATPDMMPIVGRGRIREIRGLDEAAAVPLIEEIEMEARVGDMLVPLPEGADYPGFIFARGDDPAEVEAALREAWSKVAFVL